MVCLNSFIHNLVIIPLRMITGIIMITCNLLNVPKTNNNSSIKSIMAYEDDYLKFLLLIMSAFILHLLDSSRLYHAIRGQSVLKLYVILNVFEIADRLCCSFGLDILESFFSVDDRDVSEDSQLSTQASRLTPIPHFFLALCYIVVHSIVLLYQIITLNVAMNSFSNALLTLLVSNQFVEIKSAVFKKFEKENLFQLSCADVVERMQLSVFLLIIGIRNMIERGSFEGSLYPLFQVFLSEILVDWLKHAFITKFNHIHPEIYLKFRDIISKDCIATNDQIKTSKMENVCDNVPMDIIQLLDKSPTVSRRIGFSSFPLTCVTLAMFWQRINVLGIGYSLLCPLVIVIFVL